MLSALFGCVRLVQEEVGCGSKSGREMEISPTARQADDVLDDLLKRHLLTIRGRRNIIRNIPIQIVPTKFEDDDDPPSEDEDGEETSIFRGGMFANQDFDRLRQRCRSSGKQFVDPQFPPSASSLYVDPSGQGEDLEWKRPSELVDDPAFFVDGATRFDVKQGELGDCWLLAAIANLTMHKKLFEEVVPHDQTFADADSYAGIFHFRFWQYGEWIDVVVDDLLPTRNGRLVYMRSETRHEFWSALLEKAYAKLHGCYEALRGGTACEAMVDFSGGCSEQYEVQKRDSPKGDEIFDILHRGHARASMLSCSLSPEPGVVEAKTRAGLVRGHAYSITKVVRAEIDTGRKKGLFPLVRIRNPWGNDTEWKGAWSDGAKEWKYIPEEEKERLGLTFDPDGEFFMSQADFLRHFDAVEMCHLGPDSVDDEEISEGQIKWHDHSFSGSWIKGSTAGGCRNYISSFASNPQFKVVLTDSDDDADDLCTCLVSLLQKGSRKRKAEGTGDGGCLTIGFSVYRIDEPESTPFPLETDYFRYHASTARSKTFVNAREVSARFRLQPGTYSVIPSTFEPDEEGDFLLRIFSEKGADCSDDHDHEKNGKI